MCSQKRYRLPCRRTQMPAAQRLESLESMRVAAPESARVVGPTHTGCGFALLDSDADHDPFPRQTAAEPVDNPLLVLDHSDVDCRDLPDLKKGDTVSGVSGPLTYHFDQYKIVLQDASQLQITPAPWAPLPHSFSTRRPPRSQSPPSIFTTTSTAKKICHHPPNPSYQPPIRL